VIHRASRSPLTWLGGLLALYLLVPVVAFVVRFSGSSDRGFHSPGLWSAVGVSVESATISAAVIAVFGIPLASWLARSRGPVAAVVGVVVQFPLALPPVMSGIVLIYLVGPYTTLGQFFGGQLTDSVAGVVIAQTFVASPFLIIAARSAFASVDPALEETAATLGHRSIARFFLVSLRIAGPGIRAGLLLTWLRAIGEYGATVLLAYHPYSMPVFTYVRFSDTGIPDTQAPTAVALAIAAIVLAANQIRWPARLRRRSLLPEPRAPRSGTPTTVAFDLDVTVGTFRLRLNHRATSHRVAILGPSGSGKSMTLRGVAGLLGPSAGPVHYDGRPVMRIPTEARHLGYVPQGLNLLPGRTVWQQLMFATDADPHLAAWWLRTLHLDGLQHRLPHQLSGGQRQRVGLAQALTRNPRLVLLDEPFSALDAPVREELRRELRRLQRDMGLSTVLVTHDPEEAALLADEILVIDDGVLLQAGPRPEVYARPASPRVARLLGIQNLHHGTVTTPSALTAAGAVIAVDAGQLPVGTDVLWCVRPEHVSVGAPGGYPATVVDHADTGTTVVLTVELVGGPTLTARTINGPDTTSSPDLAPGDSCQIGLDPAAITIWPQPDPTAPPVRRGIRAASR
jgi:molybdate transport system permease protein